MEPYPWNRWSKGCAHARRGAAALAAGALALLAAGCAGAPEEPAEKMGVPEPEIAAPPEPAPEPAIAAPPVGAPDPAPRVVLPPGFPDTAGRILDPDHAPTPFTAAELRAACRQGRTNTWRMTTEKGNFISVQNFVEVDAKGARIQSLLTREDGVQTGTTEASSGTWEELQSHASFPAGSTKIRSERVKLPAGEYDCWVYEVVEKDSVTKYWFARELAGPPVRVEIRRAEKQLLYMELVELRFTPPKG